MKSYKLLKDTPKTRAGAMFHLPSTKTTRDATNGSYFNYDSDEWISKENILKTEWFEEVIESKIWIPKEGEEFHLIDFGVTRMRKRTNNFDVQVFKSGEYWRTEEDAQAVLDFMIFENEMATKYGSYDLGDKMTVIEDNKMYALRIKADKAYNNKLIK